MSRPKSKRLLNAQEKFKAAVTTYILSVGARPGTFYDYVLETPAGLLHVTVYGDWVATRFDDVARGRAFTATCGHSCNPYSGKWNFHYGDGTAGSLDPNRILPHIDYFFDRLLHWEAVAA